MGFKKLLSTMSQKRRYNVFSSMILFVVLNLHTCCGFNDCYRLSSGKDICFMFDKTKRTFEESKQLCQNNSGFLLEIYDEQMQKLVEQFGKIKIIYLDSAWLNLVRTNSMWVWGSEGSDHYLTYLNWAQGYPLSNGINKAFMIYTYEWVNSNDINSASTICIKANQSTYSPETSTTTTTTSSLSPSTTPYTQSTESIKSPPTSNSVSSSAAIGIGVGVGLGGLVLIIVSSILIAKFVFHKEILLPFKSWRNRNSPPHETRTNVANGIREISRYAEVVRPGTLHPPPHSPPDIGFTHMSQPNSDEGLGRLPNADYATPLEVALRNDAYDNADRST